MGGLSANLLGLPGIDALGLVRKVHSIQTDDILSKYPELFEGLGKFDEEYIIRLKPTAVPYAIHTARHVPLPLKAAVVKELNRMEKWGSYQK